MVDNPSPSPEPLACPICRRPLRRTSKRLLSALECDQCGPFSDFTDISPHGRTPGSGHGPDDPESGPLG